ncbi:MAG: putative Ig domain-containing protein [Thermodesulfobacteriota bacterium]
MKKRNISTLSFNRAESHGLGFLVDAVVIFLVLSSAALPLSCEQKKAVEPSAQTKTNSPPTITSVTILPERPNRENDLSFIIQSEDPDGDLVSYRYQWIKNEMEMPGENGTILSAGKFAKGDIVQVSVVPSDGKVDGKAFLSNPVKILNAAPIVREVWIEPQMPTVQDDLKAHEKSADPDDDSIFFSYEWEKDGVPLMDVRGDTLERTRFKKGDSISVTIVPDDREIMGAPKKSDPVKILNSAPVIVSTPPTFVEGTIYLYQVKAADPDNDPVTFALKSGPKGMRIDPKSGLIEWQIQKEDRGSYPIDIEVSDNEGLKSYQRYTLAIEVR